MKVSKLRIDLKDIWRIRKRKYFFMGRYLTRHAYSECRKFKRLIKLHREIAGAKSGEVVDHIDGDRMNNSRKNLRVCTLQQNNSNARKRKDGKSRWKGVYPINNTTAKVWAAHIRANKRRRYIGSFEDEACAATAYNFAAAELHGEFAVYNTVPQPWLEET